jgi:flavin-dependent dehydrogenase
MRNSKFFDVVILGGGPAGLGSAVHLAEKGVPLLLLEKNKICSTKKTWLTFDHIINKYDLHECVRNRFSRVIFSCYLGNSYSFGNEGFISPIHEERALELLLQRAKSNGAIIKDKEPFLNYSIRNEENIEIRTTKGTYRTKLAIDAMGRDSSILRSYGRKNETVDMGCLAFFLKNASHKNDNQLLLYDSFFPGSDYFWIVPLEEDLMMVGIFFFSSLTSWNLREKTEKLKWYMDARDLDGEIYETKMGNIPLGPQSHTNVERFLFIGDSCNTPLPSSGFSFSRCLEESEILADFISRHLDHGTPLKDYKKEILGSKTPGIEIHLMISDMLSKFTDPMLNKAIGSMSNLDEDFIISFLSGRDMSVNFAVTALRAIFNTFSLSELRTLSLKQNYMRLLTSLYDLLLALPQAKMPEQIVTFVKGLIKGKDNPIAAKKHDRELPRQQR